MPTRSLIVLLAVLLVAAGGFATRAFVAYRGVQNERAERERSDAESAREKEAIREQERREFAKWQQEQDRVQPAEDDAIPPPREKLRLVALDTEEPDVTLPEPDAGGRLDGKAKDPPVPQPDDQPAAKLAKERSQRWVLRFKVAEGKEYVEQLKALGAEILIPLPPDNKKAILIRDLSKPEQKDATDADLKRLAGKVQFSDKRKEAVAGMMEVLKVDGKPTECWAFFPKELADELARKEMNYRNRRAEDIELTVFLVTVRGGKPEIVVADQQAKK